MEKLEWLARWKADGVIDGIVYSTWLGESAAYPEPMAALAKLDAIVVETDPPRVKTFGHTLHQAKTLWFGLQAVPDNAMVLKLRPDLGTLTARIGASLLDMDLSIAPEEGRPPPFQQRIALLTVFPEAPYYCNDILFYGLREDLLKLANFDLTTEMVVTNTVSEQFFFRPPLADRYPLMEAYLQVCPPFMPGADGRADKRRALLLASDIYLDVFAAHLRMLRSYFRVGLVPENERESEPEMPMGTTVEQFLQPQSGRADITFLGGANACCFAGERPLEALVTGRFADDALGARMRLALYRTEDSSYAATYPANPMRPTVAIRELSAQISEAFPDVLSRIDLRIDPNGRSFLVRGQFDRIVTVSDNDETKTLHNEINFLRRKLDEALQQKK